MLIVPKRLKLQTSNLTCMFPGTVRIRLLKIFRKGASVKIHLAEIRTLTSAFQLFLQCLLVMPKFRYSDMICDLVFDKVFSRKKLQTWSPTFFLLKTWSLNSISKMGKGRYNCPVGLGRCLGLSAIP